jgi:DNA (cytosine-5)-methyltransferase 1
MDEVRALPWNGLTCASTFSGCGGSSTGYRMAGFRVLYANEFIAAARDSYKANAAPYTFVDGRDIRHVTVEDFLATVKLAPGELDLLDGSPPCASFSTVGKREGGWGQVKKYSDKAQRTDDLFFEYARLVRGVQPKTFVAENVSGLVKGTAKGYFKLILAELKSCGYRVQAQLLDASWLGVPQARQRLIFVGVRNDLGLEPAFPKPLSYRYTLRDALPGLDGFIQAGDPSHARKPGHHFPRGVVVKPSDVSLTVTCAGLSGGSTVSVFARPVEREPGTPPRPHEKRMMSIAELRRICSFPDDFVLTGDYAQQWERCGRAVPPVMMSHIAAAVRDGVLLPHRRQSHAAQ